jgi:hypothetical protein
VSGGAQSGSYLRQGLLEVLSLKSTPLQIRQLMLRVKNKLTDLWGS